MKNPLHDWHSPIVSTYQNTIRQKIIGYDLIYNMMTDILRGHPVIDNTLVVGAGGGQELLTLGEAFPSSHFTAVDTSTIMRQAADQRIQQLDQDLHIDWYEDDVLSLRFHHPYDVTTCHLVLHFIKDLEQKRALLQKLATSLQNGGVLFISSINADMTDTICQQQLKYWRNSMYQNDISEEDWLRFEQSFGSTIYPIKLELLIDLLHEVGFTKIVPYFKSYLVDALVATKEEVNK
ncbi:class I SAM-dependent methyltransferase [Lysinibacillus sp. FSL K6-1151]|uniref:Methyltransferase type 12 n=1 Tax=Lysinibacillus fusiformis TaxID=28031 RepID=A0A2I0UVU0_9BACI|nr:MULTISPECIES: class I SAM-dependent methyltransferase [Lysinibacillus]PKU50220.1 methyltransferase type 12 [Lysinibacillus fusiformis]WCH47975.1 class I SAM-dependent methyltransferase [Lysinibacillus sp. OF-1]